MSWTDRDIELELGATPRTQVLAERFKLSLVQMDQSMVDLTRAYRQFRQTLAEVVDGYEREATAAVVERGEDPSLWPSIADLVEEHEQLSHCLGLR